MQNYATKEDLNRISLRIDISNLQTIPTQYLNPDILFHAKLLDNGFVYHLSYVDGNEYYYENLDEGKYRYISIYSDGNLVREEERELGGGISEERVQEMIDNSIAAALEGDY